MHVQGQNQQAAFKIDNKSLATGNTNHNLQRLLGVSKDHTLATKCSSKRMLLDLMSLWQSGGLQKK
jgi:hypothetical protein